MNILVTGCDGFIGKNLCSRLVEDDSVQVVRHSRNAKSPLNEKVQNVDFVCHLAGVNRPDDPAFFDDNFSCTVELCEALRCASTKTPVWFASSIQVNNGSPYGNSKLKAEEELQQLSRTRGNPVIVARLANVFGKWARPNYNSVVATFCHNLAKGLEIEAHDPDKSIELLYVDDLVEQVLQTISNRDSLEGFCIVNPDGTYHMSVGEMAATLKDYSASHTESKVSFVGSGIERALYATYLSYLEPKDFFYELTPHDDERGRFVEVLKTPLSGQFSFFSVKPGVERGGHYHHTKSEKFVVVAGEAEFIFKHLLSGQKFRIQVSGDKPEVIQSIPGWIHSVRNTGGAEMLVVLWANEVFDADKPDTYVLS